MLVFVVLEDFQYGTGIDEVWTSISGAKAFLKESDAEQYRDSLEKEHKAWIEKEYASQGLRPGSWRSYRLQKLDLE